MMCSSAPRCTRAVRTSGMFFSINVILAQAWWSASSATADEERTGMPLQSICFWKKSFGSAGTARAEARFATAKKKTIRERRIRASISRRRQGLKVALEPDVVGVAGGRLGSQGAGFGKSAQMPRCKARLIVRTAAGMTEIVGDRAV